MALNKIFSLAVISGLFLLLLTPLLISRSLLFPFITGKAFFFRILIEVVFFLWIVLLWREPTYRPRKSWLLLSVVGLVAVSALATIFGQNPYHSFWSNFERMDGLISYLHLSAYFLVIASTFRTEKIWQWFFHSSIGVSLVVAFYSLAQIAGAIPISQGRLDSTLGNAIYLAVYMLFHVFLTTFLLVKHWRHFWLRFVYVPIIILQTFILYKTATRGAIIGFLVGIGVSTLLIMIKKWSDRRIRVITLGVVGAFVLLVGGFWFSRHSDFVVKSPVLSRFASISLTDATTDSRLTIWQMSLRGFREHPILGWGPENYNLVFNKYFEPKLWRQEQWFDRSHNIFLDWMIDAGVLGLLSYLSLFVTAIYYLWRSRQTVIIKSLFTGLLVAYLVNNFFAFDNLTSYLVFFSFLAYLHYLNFSEDAVAVGKFSRYLSWNNGHTAGVIILVFLLSGSLYYFNLRPISASTTLIQAIGDSGSGLQPENVASRRLALFKKVFAAGTFANRESTEQLFGQVMNIVGNPIVSDTTKQEFVNLTVDEMKKEIKTAPEDARAHLLLGSMLVNIGKFPDALPVLVRASELSPKKQTIRFQLASAYLNSGEKKKALDIAEETFRLDENFPEARKLYALIALYNNDIKLANALLESFVTSFPSELLDERLVQAYGVVRDANSLGLLWQRAVQRDPLFEQDVNTFLVRLRKEGVIE
ncbi:O-antigen ligase family protein [Candidatus Nomurabacteria bacterium]|nr:O-antigen ligase family protein [Candidatus Nomurabacteria bacterium]